jgi:hypothetical protein
LIGVMEATSRPHCRPALTVEDVRLSEMEPPTLQRRWTAVVSVDASRCAATAGSFAVVFSRLKDSGPDLEFRERFTWAAPSVAISVTFWADEAVERFRLDDVVPCPCRE